MPSAFGRKGAPGIVTAFKPFSPKQMQALTWWCPGSPHSGKSGIICDGAVRSGKTLCMSLSFVSWAFYRFRDTAFALCGKTVASLRRNVLTPLTEQLTALGFTCTFKISRSELTVRRDAPKKENDHAMDDIRYFVSTVLNGEEPGGVCALAVERK